MVRPKSSISAPIPARHFAPCTALGGVVVGCACAGFRCKGQPLPEDGHVYRLSHPLGEHVLDAGRRHDTGWGVAPSFHAAIAAS